MRIAIVASLVVAAFAVGTHRGEAADEIPEPRLDRIDYAHPEKYVSVPATLGKRETLDKISGEIEAKTPREKLVAIGTWIDAHLKYDASTFDRWRDVDRLLADGSYGGCADHATFFGAVARSCGIPTVWVKSLDLDWIAWFRAHPDQPRSWNGHVFVEVHVDGKWRLYDASQRVLYDDYDVRQRILPGHRLAYDKGGDPFELLLSTRWDDWKKQTPRFVASLDLSLVPVGAGMKMDPPGRVYVAATHPAWKWVVDRCNRLGAKLGSLSGCGDEELWLPNARRGVLIVPSAAGQSTLPEKYRTLLPLDLAKWREGLGEKTSAVVRKKAADGTDVVLILARDDDTLKAAVDAFTLDARSAPPATAGQDPATPKTDRPATVFVVARTAEYYALTERCRSMGLQVSGGDAAFDKWMPGARGRTLVVVSVGGELLLPETYRHLMPADADAIRDVLKTKSSDVLRQKAEDGTEVVLLVARDQDSMKAAIEGLTFEGAK